MQCRPCFKEAPHRGWFQGDRCFGLVDVQVNNGDIAILSIVSPSVHIPGCQKGLVSQGERLPWHPGWPRQGFARRAKKGIPLPKSQDNSNDGVPPDLAPRLAGTAARRDADHSGELRRLAALQRLRDLLPQDQPRLDGLCRVASFVTASDAAGVAFLSDRFLYFAGRHGDLPDRDVRGFAIQDLYHKVILIPEARQFAGHARMNCFNGKFAAYKSMVAVAVHYDTQPVALLACYSHQSREGYGPEATACLFELAYMIEAHLVQEATLAHLARTAVQTLDRMRGPAP